MTRTAKTFELHINKETFRRAMSVAAVFLLLLMVALPTGDHQPTDIASLQLTKIVSVPQIQSATNNIEFVTTTNEEPITTESKESTIADSIAAPETVIKECPSPMVSVTPSTIFAPSSELFEAPVTEPTPAAVATSKKTYHVIVASLPSHHGAKETLNKYIRMGYTEASLVERDNRVRVSLMQFTDKDEANHQIDILRQQKVFKNAWMLAVRN